jgi:hypothetical protein
VMSCKLVVGFNTVWSIYEDRFMVQLIGQM